ncbi:hypothetical protein VSH64_21390 [Amycolatopsis rhabdoformis]|uniref:Rhodanese domain-containing protein n=1 Tax=Amycolatopsis rhabdoformis TaxID=1448059 RepID=A0ABZ1IJH3_9PSEU|nr:hypothetical protein [Amycolatopsis rhabdoformis]WSE34605.1 hypothetical protein VSH64_21390 [Amycolatopsis rhabdoformis]
MTAAEAPEVVLEPEGNRELVGDWGMHLRAQPGSPDTWPGGLPPAQATTTTVPALVRNTGSTVKLGRRVGWSAQGLRRSSMSAMRCPRERSTTAGREHRTTTLPVDTESGCSPTATADGSDPATIRNFNNVLNQGMHDVIAHGTRDGFIEIDGETVNGGQLADALRANPDYQEGQPCCLVVCHTGVSGVGRRLSDELGVPVIAPNERVGTDWELGPGQESTVFGEAGRMQLYPRG